jgi:hypothetical protein
MHGEVLVTFEAGYGPSFGDEDLVVERRVISFLRQECTFEPYGLRHHTDKSERIYPWHTIRTVEMRVALDEVGQEAGAEETVAAQASVGDVSALPHESDHE